MAEEQLGLLLPQGSPGRRTLGFGKGRCQEEQGREAEAGPQPELRVPQGPLQALLAKSRMLRPSDPMGCPTVHPS